MNGGFNRFPRAGTNTGVDSNVKVLYPNGVNDNVQIQAAINAVPTKGGVVELSAGDYVLKATITFPNDRNVVLRGQSTDALTGGGARLYFAPVGDISYGINIDNTGYSSSTYLTGSSVVLEGLSLYEQNFISSSGGKVNSMVHIANRSKVECRNVVTYGGQNYGFHGDTTFIDTFYSCKSVYAGKNAFYFTSANEIFFLGCQGVGAGIFNASLGAGEGYGLAIVTGTANYWLGDLSNNGNHSALATGDLGGGFYFDAVQISKVAGYYEPSSSSRSSRVGYLTSTCQGNSFEDLFHGAESMVQDYGAENQWSATQTSRDVKHPAGKVTNWAVDSSFESGATTRWFGSGVLSIQNTGTTDGPVSGKCLRIKNNTGSTAAINAEQYFAGPNGITGLTQLTSGYVVTFSMWARATKNCGGAFPTFFQIGMGGGTPISAGGTPLPFLDTTWRRVEYTGVMTSTQTDGLLVLTCNLVDQDYIEVGDIQIVVEPASGRSPLKYPYIRTGPSLVERSASLELPDLVKLAGDVDLISSKSFKWYSTTDFTGSVDTALDRASAGIVKISNGGATLGSLEVIASNSVAGVYFGTPAAGSSAWWSSGTLIYAASGTNSTYVDVALRDALVQRNLYMSSTSAHTYFGSTGDLNWNSTTTAASSSNDTILSRSIASELTLTNGSAVLGSFSTGGLRLQLASKSADYTATAFDHTIVVNATGASRTITLPAAASNTGRIYVIKKTDSSGNTVTVDANASETIDGALTYVITAQYQTVTIQCDGSNWHIT